MKNQSGKTSYGNWVPEKMLYAMLIEAGVLLAAALVSGLALGLGVLAAVFGVLCAAVLVYDGYMYICHELFAFGKGNMMAKVHDHLVEHLDWSGEGRLAFPSYAKTPCMISGVGLLYGKK